MARRNSRPILADSIVQIAESHTGKQLFFLSELEGDQRRIPLDGTPRVSPAATPSNGSDGLRHTE